jgi:hypothetical protein
MKIGVAIDGVDPAAANATRVVCGAASWVGSCSRDSRDAHYRACRRFPHLLANPADAPKRSVAKSELLQFELNHWLGAALLLQAQLWRNVNETSSFRARIRSRGVNRRAGACSK